MPRKDDLSPKTIYIEEVPGVSVDWDWAGRDGSGNRRRIPSNYFITADNIRLEDGEAQGRKGLAKVNSSDSSDTSCVIGISDLPTISINGRFFITLGPVSNVKLYIFDSKVDDTKALDVDPDQNAERSEYLIKYGGNIYGDEGKSITLRENAGTIRAATGEQIIYPEPKVDHENTGISSQPGSQAVVAPTLDSNRAGQDDVYFTSADVTINPTVYRWDGNQSYVIGEASDFSNASVQHVGYVRERVFVVVSPVTEGSPCVYMRDFDGTWTAFNCPTLTQESQFNCFGITYFNDEALLHGWQTGNGGGGSAYGTILVFDGSTLSLGTETGQVGSSEASIRGIYDACTYNGNYYYPYELQAGTSYLGRYNGSTFSDTQVDLTDKIDNDYGPVGIAAKGGLLLLTAYEWGNDFNTKMYTTTDLSTFTELTVENTGDISIDPPHKVFVL